MLTTVFSCGGFFLVGVRQRRKIFCALFQYAGGGLLSRYDVAFTVH